MADLRFGKSRQYSVVHQPVANNVSQRPRHDQFRDVAGFESTVLALADADFVSRSRESPYDFYQAVEAGNHLFQGVCDATLPHDEGWQFIQLGKYLERAEKTIRILDVKQQQLAVMTDVADLPLLNLEWASVLKSCLAYESFQSASHWPGRVGKRH